MKIYRVIYEITNEESNWNNIIQDKFFKAEDEFKALRRFKEIGEFLEDEMMIWNVVEVNELPEGRKATK